MPDTLAKKDKPVARCLIVDANGTLGTGEDRPLTAPAIRVKVVKAIGGDDGSSKGFEPLVEYMGPGDTEPTAVAEVYGRTGWFAKEDKAWDAAREHAAATVYQAESDARERGDTEALVKLRRFRSVLMDRCIVERAKIKGQKSVEYGELVGDDFALALGIAAEFFAEIDAQIIIGFRERIPSDGHEWTRGKCSDGSSRYLAGKAEKLGSEKPGLLRASMGYAPQVMVTVCGVQWRAFDRRQKAAVLHDLLSRIGYDPEKKSVFIHEPIGAFPATLREFADTKPTGALELAQAMIEGLIDCGEQLEIVGLHLDADATKTDHARVSKASALDITKARIANRERANGDGSDDDQDSDHGITDDENAAAEAATRKPAPRRRKAA